jgi:hypothetical protein
MMEKRRRPLLMTLDEQMRQHMPEECFVEPPSAKSWIAVGMIWSIALIIMWIALLF